MASDLEVKIMDAEWVIKINEEQKRLEDETSMIVERPWKKRSIYKVPPHMTDLNKNAYRPQVVSFGPYHHGDEHLMPMEEHKQRALSHFLKRTKKPFQIIVDNLTKVVQDLKDSYDLLGDVWQSDTDGFLRLMVLDGCFMLEVLCSYDEMSDNGILGYFTKMSDSCNYAPNDPIFSPHEMLHVIPYIRRDMLLLENQLPMRVLIELAAAMTGEDTEKGNAQELVTLLVCNFTDSFWLATVEYLHVLDIFRKGMFWSEPKKQREHTTPPHYDNQIIVSAMELQEAGIRFKAIKTGSKLGCVDVISFKDSVLCFPVFVVDDTTESRILNVIAYERLHVQAGNEVTSYICFMGAIINNVRDVILLKSNGIIQNAIGSEEAIVQLFKSLSKGTTLEPNSKLDLVHKEIRKYRGKPWIQFRANFVRAYHVSTQWNPLAYISIIFAILIFTLTVVQTAYSIFPYYRPNK